MTNEEKYGYWLEVAQYDLDSASAMFETGRWFYVVFMCQQAVEKLVKGVYGLYLDYDTIPRTHNIRRLVGDFSPDLLETVSEETYELFDLLSDYYLNNRYPDYIDDLLQQTTQSYAKDVLNRTKEVFSWLLTLTMKPPESL
jgi:HEPN domain-containing protein